MKDGHQHDDAYSVSPAHMDPEQIARRDASSMTIAELAEHVAAQSVTLNVQLEQLCKSVDALQSERDALLRSIEIKDSCYDKTVIDRDALRSVLRQIVYEFHNTYDAESDTDGRWRSAASIPVSVMNRAEKLVGAI